MSHLSYSFQADLGHLNFSHFSHISHRAMRFLKQDVVRVFKVISYFLETYIDDLHTPSMYITVIVH